MEIYLPIADLSVNIFWLLFLGFISGVFSGLFGIGGGFFTTSVLIFIGIIPTVAVSSSSNQIIGSSIAGFFYYYKEKLFDLKLAVLISIGGAFGSVLGIILFNYLVSIDLINTFIIASYIVFLGVNSILILRESLTALIKKQKEEVVFDNSKKLNISQLPFLMDFKYINQKVSGIIPFFSGIIAGILVSIMGIGGGFVLIPIMIYILRVPTKIALGTSLFQIIISSTIVTFLQATTNHTVDIILVGLMTLGAVVGALVGGNLNRFVKPVYLRLSLSMMMMLLVIKISLTAYNQQRNLRTNQIIIDKNVTNEIGKLSALALDLSVSYPYLYGLICIALVMLMGILTGLLYNLLRKNNKIANKKQN